MTPFHLSLATANDMAEPVIFKSQPAMVETAVWNEVQEKQVTARAAGAVSKRRALQGPEREDRGS